MAAAAQPRDHCIVNLEEELTRREYDSIVTLELYKMEGALLLVLGISIVPEEQPRGAKYGFVGFPLVYADLFGIFANVMVVSLDGFA
jgi:hypothetical protein